VSDVHLPQTVATAPSRAPLSPEGTERALLAQISAGNRSALAQFYLLYFQRLHNFFTHLTANPKLGEELVTETMFDVWRTSERAGSSRSVFLWVMGIAYIHAHRRLVSGKAIPSHLEPMANDVEPDSQSSSTVATPPRLVDLLARLTIEERAALYFAYCSNQSRQDVVHIMNISGDRVDMHLRNARRRIRQ
jgi:DNA-directed RNA polymerase specialized sigma24 family protein